MQSAPDYSVIIPAYNEAEILSDTLSSLQTAMAEISLNGEIIVVDNNSTDATSQIAKDYGVHVIFERINQISRARNTGARSANGKYLIFQDADTFVCKAILEKALFNLESGNFSGGGGLVQVQQHISKLATFCETLWMSLSKKFNWAAGCFIYCTREAYDAVQGFDESIYITEEIWFSRRLNKWGKVNGLQFKIIESPKVVTSNRKFDWYGPHVFLLWGLLYLCFPFLACFRKCCPIWYKRPQ